MMRAACVHADDGRPHRLRRRRLVRGGDAPGRATPGRQLPPPPLPAPPPQRPPPPLQLGPDALARVSRLRKGVPHPLGDGDAWSLLGGKDVSAPLRSGRHTALCRLLRQLPSLHMCRGRASLSQDFLHARGLSHSSTPSPAAAHASFPACTGCVHPLRLGSLLQVSPLGMQYDLTLLPSPGSPLPYASPLAPPHPSPSLHYSIPRVRPHNSDNAQRGYSFRIALGLTQWPPGAVSCGVVTRTSHERRGKRRRVD